MTKKRWLIYCLTVVPMVLLLLLLGWASVRPQGEQTGLLATEGISSTLGTAKPIPAFKLESLLDDTILENATFQGDIVMIDFWSSWCPPCRAEAAGLMDAYLEYRDHRVEFLGIAIWDSEDDALMHLREFGVTYPNGIDKEGRLAIGFGVKGIPEKFFLNRHGELVLRHVGPITTDKLRSILDRLVASQG